MRCDLCRHSCKEHTTKCTNMYPKESALGSPIHFKEDPTKHYGKHESSSHMCVVCKDYFNRSKIQWVRGKQGLYSMCPVCASRHHYIVQNVPVG